MYKKPFLLGCLSYIVLIAFSIIFYKERAIFVDIAFHLFSIITNNDFAIQNFRFGAICTQVFPFAALKAGAPLATMALVYSVSFILFYFSCYLACGVVFKNYRLALVLLLCNILFASETFYWIQSELPQTMAIMMVTLAVLSSKNIHELPAAALALAFTGIVAIAFTHPLIIFPFVYAIAFFYLNKETIIERRTLWAVLLFYLAVVAIKNLFFKTQYESHAMGGAKNLVTMFPHYLGLYSNHRFFHQCLTRYYWIPISTVLITVTYLSWKQYKKLFLFLVTGFCYLQLINVSYPNADTTLFYIENMYLPLGLFIALPLVYDVMPALKPRQLSFYVMALIALTGFVRIYQAHKPYTVRLNWERDFLSRNADKKILMNAKSVPLDTLLMTWGMPYEFWLLSTLENKKTASIAVLDNVDDLSGALHDKTKYMVTWGFFNYSDLPKKYFILEDTSSTYSIIK